MKRILVVTPYERDANSFWRCMGPMNYMQKNSKNEVQITLAQSSMGIAWCDIMQYDLVFLHRPCRPDDLTIMKIAHNCNVPTWVDYDDWLFDIPSWNQSSKSYNSSATQHIMAQCLVSADMISCSTQALFERFKQVNPNVILLKNAYRSDLFHYRRSELSPRRALAYWRGSDTHDGDLLSVKDGFKSLDAQMLFLGSPSWILLASMKPNSYSVVPSQDVILYYKYIYDLNAKICVFPLVDCFFNECKSNIAYIEALHAGAICIAPDMPEWRKQGVITYKPHDFQDFNYSVNTAIHMDTHTHQSIVESAFESMKAEYDITQINQVRLELALNLTKDHSLPTPYDQPAAMNAISILKGKVNGEKVGIS